ncbi:MAG: serine/threonine protein kinase, partial [Cyanothece sp. SIO1E1]|nr:serine/threonine protein kinase [Cyanothece sp. SIO1E1]
MQQPHLINNRYQIQRVIGQGGFGRTYLAADRQRFGELCVLKKLLPIESTAAIARKSRELFEREAKVLYQIDHPQIPKFLAWFTERNQLFIVQEYIDGHTYFELLKMRQRQGKAFAVDEVVQWLQDLLPVLEHIHSLNIVHRDISLGNIMLPKGQSQPVLIDFGVVREVASQIWPANVDRSTHAGHASLVGKPGYSPPEQIRLGQCYPCSDLYALGVTAITLLTGRDPTWLMASGSPPSPWQAYAKVSSHVAQILNKMVAEKPKNRYQSASEALRALQALRPAVKVATSSATPSKAVPPGAKPIVKQSVADRK